MHYDIMIEEKIYVMDQFIDETEYWNRCRILQSSMPVSMNKNRGQWDISIIYSKRELRI